MSRPEKQTNKRVQAKATAQTTEAGGQPLRSHCFRNSHYLLRGELFSAETKVPPYRIRRRQYQVQAVFRTVHSLDTSILARATTRGHRQYQVDVGLPRMIHATDFA